MCSKTTILSRSYNELILEFDRLCCGDKDGRVCGDVQVSGFSDEVNDDIYLEYRGPCNMHIRKKDAFILDMIG